MINVKFQSVSSQRRKPKRVIKNIIDTITLIAIRNTPQTIPWWCTKGYWLSEGNSAAEMWILQVLWIVLSVLCSLLLSFCICQVQQFCRTISYGVPSCPLPCILFIVRTSLQGMFVVCHISQTAILVMVSHFWNRYCRFPFRLSNSFPLCLAPRHYSLSYEVCKPYCHVGFPMSELCCFYMRRALKAS